MSEQTLIEIAKSQIAAFNDSDWEALRSICSADVVYNEKGTNRKIEGIEALIEANNAWKGLMADCYGHLEGVMVSGNWVIMELKFTGTMTGPFISPEGVSIPANGKTLENPSVCLYRISEGKVVEMRHYFDMMNMMIQFDLIK